MGQLFQVTRDHTKTCDEIPFIEYWQDGYDWRKWEAKLNEYPQFSVIIFPYLFLTKELGGDSLLKLAQAKQMGVIGLKPFGAGMTFNLKPREIHDRIDARAAIMVRKMLQEKRLSAVIPGVNIPEQLEMNVRG